MPARKKAGLLGRRGKRGPATRRPPQARRHLTSPGAKSRSRSLQAARRVAENFLYLEAVLELRGGSPTVIRMKTFEGPLPGIYPTPRANA